MMQKLHNSLLEKKSAAVELIKARLLETPSDPKLWYVSHIAFYF